MKHRLHSSLGILGLIIWGLFATLMSFAPLHFLDFNFWIDFVIILSISTLPILGLLVNAVIWIWALIKCIMGPQDLFAIIYYILFVLNATEIFLNIFAVFNSSPTNTQPTRKTSKSYLPTILIVVGLIISFGLNVYMLIRNNSLSNDNLLLQSELKTSSETILELEQIVATLDEESNTLKAENNVLSSQALDDYYTIKRLESKKDSAEKKVRELTSENQKQADLLLFYNKNSVLLCSKDFLFFHQSDCPTINLDNCYLVPLSTALDAPIHPCLKCHGVFSYVVLDKNKKICHFLDCHYLPALEDRSYISYIDYLALRHSENYDYTDCPYCPN